MLPRSTLPGYRERRLPRFPRSGQRLFTPHVKLEDFKDLSWQTYILHCYVNVIRIMLLASQNCNSKDLTELYGKVPVLMFF